MSNRMICPECHCISVAYDQVRRIDRCLWKDCNWNSMEDDREALEHYTADFRPAIEVFPKRFGLKP